MSMTTAATQSRETLEELLEKMGIVNKLTVHASEELIRIEIDTPDAKGLIGPRGETLAALQTIASLLVSRKLGNKVYLLLDINGYRAQREETITKLAQQAAEAVMQGGKPITLEPMQPFERRVVHMVLQGYPELATESEGEGENRCVVIKPA